MHQPPGASSRENDSRVYSVEKNPAPDAGVVVGLWLGVVVVVGLPHTARTYSPVCASLNSKVRASTQKLEARTQRHQTVGCGLGYRVQSVGFRVHRCEALELRVYRV